MEGKFRQLANKAKHGVSAEPLPAHVSHIDPSPPDPCSPPTCHHPHLTFCTWGQKHLTFCTCGDKTRLMELTHIQVFRISLLYSGNANDNIFVMYLLKNFTEKLDVQK